jgi:protein-S-isoprenylcysteine O-methyltransferase Ste14
MSQWFSRFGALPDYALAGLALLVLYAIQSEIRFGALARTHRPGASDRNSTLAISLSAAIPVLGFLLAMKANSTSFSPYLPAWFRHALVPGIPLVPWTGVALGAIGICLRLWAVLTLRERYTRTLLVQDQHPIEHNGPYRWVRHPGYLGSLLTLNGVALASANIAVFAASLFATSAAYAYRIRIEDEMLTAALGPRYTEYRHQVAALIPFVRPSAKARQSRPDA